DVLGAGHHALGGEVHGLLRRAALAVDRHARDLLRQPGGEPGGAPDVAGLGADRVEAAVDDVLHGAGIDARPGHQLLQRVGAEVGRVDAGQAPTSPSDGGPDGVDDV